MSVILGINAFHAGASAALVIDGEVVSAIAEERMNRIKYYAGFPRLAVRACLAAAGLDLTDVEAVAIGRDPRANRGRKLAYALSHPSKLPNFLKIRSARGQLNDLRALIAAECEVDVRRLRFSEHRVEHHIAHLASAYFVSGWKRAAGFSADGSGDFVTTMMAECSGREIKPIWRIYAPHSLGSLYMMISEFIGYNQYGDEGKVMGLAPLGQNTFKEHFDDMVELRGDGFRLNPKFFLPLGTHQGMSITPAGEMVVHRHFSDHVVEKFGPPREPSCEITQRDMDLAYGVQYAFEKVYLHLLRLLHDAVPRDRVVIAGGCALNSVANGKIFEETPFLQTYIQPAAGDDGLALGAALYVSQFILKEPHRPVMRNAYLGPEYSERSIERELTAAGVSFERLERQELIERTADEIVQGRIVGWFQGRMEWGPRALGCRSIVGHPGFPGMKDILNERIKRRESFRPFAPAVLQERQSEIFEHDHPSPFMLHVYKIRPEWRERLSAVNHVDDTGRLQSVEREQNPMFYDLISAFEQRTGIPVLLNTSFNENEPVVNSPAEAIDCYLRTRMDALAIGSFLCRKSGT